MVTCYNIVRIQISCPGLDYQILEVVYVWDHNFVVSQPISVIFGALESTVSLLSKTLKTVEIASEMKKL